MPQTPWEHDALDLLVPQRLVAPASWSEHIPFAFWLINALRPGTLVELGVHTGNSLCAFNQAIDHLGLETRVFGVDHWHGDVHAGHYSESFYDELSSYHDPRYGRFSTLLKMGFEEAVEQFPDGSIDLLHIDGLHTYEAVKHDFDTWRAKLSPRAVVLFHDTNVRHGGFGVWRFWNEVARDRDAFEFLHGHGLGVLSMASVPLAPDLAAFFAAGRDSQEKARARLHFARLGQSCSTKINLDENRRQLHNIDDRAAQLAGMARQANAEIDVLSRQLDSVNKHRDELRALEPGNARWHELAIHLSGATGVDLNDFADALKRLFNSGSPKAMLDRSYLRDKLIRLVEQRSLAPLLFPRGQMVARSVGGRLLRSADYRARKLIGNDTSQPVPASPASSADPAIQTVRTSGFFDPDYYAASAEARSAGIDPLEHYLTVGERRGLAPSPLFDPVYYARRYSDVSAEGFGLLRHFVLFGSSEGREGLSPATRMQIGPFKPATRPRMILIVHEASRTGAPILGWNLARALQTRFDVIVVLKSGGAIEPAFASVCSGVVRIPDPGTISDYDMEDVAERIVAEIQPEFAIANSAETRDLVPLLSRRGVGILQLVHEFPATLFPIYTIEDMLLFAHQVVFPADVVAQSFIAEHPFLEHRRYALMAQGEPELPPAPPVTDPLVVEAQRRTMSRLPEADDPEVFLVVGLGSVEYRKGVDLFVAAASAAVRHAPDKDLRFVWIGSGYKPGKKLDFSSYLGDQVRRSGLGDKLVFVDEVDDLDAFYARASLLALTSRLDPMPNTAIGALKRGVPVVAFDEASGIAEVMMSDPALCDLVVPFLDTNAMGAKIAALASDRDGMALLSSQAASLADRAYDMDRYLDDLVHLGADVAREAATMAEDQESIVRSGLFDVSFFNGERTVRTGRAEDAALTTAIHDYLIRNRIFVGTESRRSPYGMRRPMPGFNPLIYAEAHPGLERDPMADWLARDQPEGRWTHRVLRLDEADDAEPAGARVLVHGHFFYADLVPQFLRRLAHNRVKPDVVLTTSDETQLGALRDVCAQHGFDEAEIRIVANRGRDIGPFLTGLADLITPERYDIVGHVHGKKSLHTSLGTQWRDFLFEHLIGGEHRAADAAIAEFERDPDCGLIFAEDPNFYSWDKNWEDSRALATRMGIDTLPDVFEGPIGTMFWARPEALQPLFDLQLSYEDYPIEPVGEDGTILHALERLIPFVVEKSGFGYATTHTKAAMR